jgi:hypothetical protein
MPETTHKDLYRKLCAEEPTIPLFSRDWWLDAVCGDDWDVCLVEKGGKVLASMPYYYQKNRLGMKIICQPKETQTLGPWLSLSNAKNANRLGQEKDLMKKLIYQLPQFFHFHQNWHHTVKNWLPFFWQGFQQTTFYTYRIPNLVDIKAVWEGFRENIRTDVRKAKDRFKLIIQENIPIETFLDLNEKTFARQKRRMPYAKSLIKQIDKACEAHSVRRNFVAVDEVGRPHAGVYIVWDEQSAYYLLGGSDPELRSSGATSLCLWEAIQFSAGVSKSFDFEGSMIESVERFFRAFGAIQTPYFSIQKTPSKFLKIARCVKDTVF